MEILDNESDLAAYLGGQRQRRITLVSAFASSTESLVDSLLQNGNQLEVVIGTINSFTSPDFIEHCSSEAGPNLSLWVDFRYHQSVHWKLYLIEPDIVILGSANFTQIGVSLVRDTCVVLSDASLYQAYLTKVELIKSSARVLSCTNAEEFEGALESYKVAHRRMQAGLARTAQFLDGESWLAEESNQSIPLFIWESAHTAKSRGKAQEHLSASSDGVAWSEVKDFFTYECDEGELSYEEGDVVLTARSDGAYIGFYTFDRILYRDGVYYIYAYRKKRYSVPFKLEGVKKRLKAAVPNWYEESRIEINRADISEIINCDDHACRLSNPH